MGSVDVDLAVTTLLADVNVHLGKPEGDEGDALREEGGASVDELRRYIRSQIESNKGSGGCVIPTLENLGMASTRWEATRSRTHSGGSWPICV